MYRFFYIKNIQDFLYIKKISIYQEDGICSVHTKLEQQGLM